MKGTPLKHRLNFLSVELRRRKRKKISGILFRERPRGVENSGGWKTYRKFGEKPLPKNVFGPPTYDTFPPPPFFWRLSVISLKRKRHRPDQPQFLRPPKVVLESTLCSTFSPPPKFTRYVLPPPQPLPNLLLFVSVGCCCGLCVPNMITINTKIFAIQKKFL